MKIPKIFQLKFISLPVFLISFALGMFAVYLFEPDNKKIMVYPSPDNSSYIQYKDKADNCFQVKETKTKCSADAQQIPIQSG